MKTFGFEDLPPPSGRELSRQDWLMQMAAFAAALVPWTLLVISRHATAPLYAYVLFVGALAFGASAVLGRAIVLLGLVFATLWIAAFVWHALRVGVDVADRHLPMLYTVNTVFIALAWGASREALRSRR